MRYPVPQFIEIEDKILGPLTLKQLLYLAAGGAIVAFAWYFLKFWAFLLVAIPVGGIAGAFAFIKINGLPFAKIISAFINYKIKPRLYVWKKGK